MLSEDGLPAPIPHATLHDLPRTFGIHFADQEPRMHIVLAVLGHKNLETAKKFYVYAKQKKVSKAVSHLALGSGSPSLPRRTKTEG